MTDILEIASIIITIISFMVAIANIILLIGLIRIFHSNYRKIKAKFTKGLLTFVAFLLVQQIFFLMGLIVINTFRQFSAGGPIFFLNVLELIALIIFYRTTRE
ncbi:MAG: hypothetical protein U9R75_07040 [Candidatus Thermoplasmatota archaeon]|nr:hypothetical protein [Candidatus Thermoplasmatota archaeon]